MRDGNARIRSGGQGGGDARERLRSRKPAWCSASIFLGRASKNGRIATF